jgi:hypothetical protein
MVRAFVLFVMLPLLACCTKSSKPEEFRSDRGHVVFFAESYYIDVELSFEDVWPTVLAALDDLDWVVDGQSEPSGEITTKEMTIGTNRDRYACRQWPGSRTRVDEMTSKLSLHVASDDGVVTRIRVLADINGRYIYIGSSGEEKVGGWWPCTSTGEMESEFFDALLVRLEPLKYDPPVYRKWESG